MKYYRNITATLALVAILGTVAPASVSAVSTIKIDSYASASSNTGGNSVIDGEDGRDGSPGKDGKDGEDGQDGVSTKSTGSVHIESYVNGTKVTDVHFATTSGKVESESSLVVSESDVVEEGVVSDASSELSDEDISRLQKLLNSIQLILLQYVSSLF